MNVVIDILRLTRQFLYWLRDIQPQVFARRTHSYGLFETGR